MEITAQEALDCFASDDLIGIGMEADAVRRALHPGNVVTYVVSRAISLDQSPAERLAAIEDCVRAGDTTICLTCAPLPSLNKIEEALVASRQRFPSLRLQALSTADILALAESSGVVPCELLSRLHAAGLDSLCSDNLAAIHEANGTISFDTWLEIHRLAHRAGMTSTASLIFGMGETAEDHVHRLFAIRALQAETNRFAAFTLLTATPSTHLEPPTAVEYLRTLAIARIVLDNVPSIESSCQAQGLKVVQMALRFGANDAGALASANATRATFTEEDLRRVIRDAGFTPVERDPLYRTVYLNN
jgi:cyclic dehypoxanthinyl futalosine synthase